MRNAHKNVLVLASGKRTSIALPVRSQSPVVLALRAKLQAKRDAGLNVGLSRVPNAHILDGVMPA